ncbi:flagellar basal body P-ring formation chaperone FlgA [uncultured Roseovarius sp.]|uniref:flagellar basal body P-ring formation chaperone FlgA n=1 Tax=uncultured Roseovarius sp. TaxID=293344 RepID=UPI00260B0B4D|nr:flagellar basal body P-ring formation chaperone FlgA [uncultured Roseovarius sp.]
MVGRRCGSVAPRRAGTASSAFETGRAGPRIGSAGREIAQTRALVLVESLPRGTVLNTAHLERADIPVTGQGDLVVARESAIGRRLKVHLGAGQAPLGRYLDHDWPVNKGAPVTIAGGKGPIRIETAGVALEPGQLGQAIQVTNARSGQLVHAIVTGLNKVTARPNIR